MEKDNHTTVKVVSQVEHLVYQGVRQKKQASVSKMNALLGIQSETKSDNGRNGVKTSLSRTLFVGTLNVRHNAESECAAIADKPLRLCTEATVNRFMTLGDIATSKRKEFFKKVEEGKARLMSKYGERKAVPVDEVVSLAEELRSYSCTIWKHQIVVTRTQSTPFEGARSTKDGRYTATVKSKTIYTMAPLTESQLDELEKILVGELESNSAGKVAQRATENGKVAFWRNPVTGNIVMIEDSSQFC